MPDSPIGSFARGFGSGFASTYGPSQSRKREEDEARRKEQERNNQRQELLKRYEVLIDPNATDEDKKSAYAMLQISGITPPSNMLEKQFNAQLYLDKSGLPKDHPLRYIADDLKPKDLYDEVTKATGSLPVSLEDFQILEEAGILPNGMTAEKAYGLNYLATTSKLPAGVISDWNDRMFPGKPTDPEVKSSMLQTLMHDAEGNLRSPESFTPSEWGQLEQLGFSPDEVRGWYNLAGDNMTATMVKKSLDGMVQNYIKAGFDPLFGKYRNKPMEYIANDIFDFVSQVERMALTAEPTDRIKRIVEYINKSEAKKSYPNAQAMYVAMIEAHNDPTTEFSRYSIDELKMTVQYLFPQGGKLIWTPKEYQTQEKLEGIGEAKKKYEGNK